MNKVMTQTSLSIALLIALLLVGCSNNTPTPPADMSQPTPVPATASPPPSESSDDAMSGAGSDADATTEDSNDPAAIIQESINAMNELTSYQASIDMRFTGAQEGEVSMDVILRGSPVNGPSSQNQNPNQAFFKGEVTQSTLPSVPPGSLAIHGPTSYVYDPLQNVVVTSEQQALTSALYDLFLGSQLRMYALCSPNVAAPKLIGDETIGPFTAIGIELVPKADTADRLLANGAKGTVWIDTATHLPVRFAYTQDDMHMSWIVHRLETTQLDEDQFTFIPPSGVVTIHSDERGQTTVAATIDEAATQADFTPLVPTYLPHELLGESATIRLRETSHGTYISQSYSVSTQANAPGMLPETHALSLQAFNGAVYVHTKIPGISSTQTVRGQDATMTIAGANTIYLRWKEDDVWYTLIGIGISETDMLNVATELQEP